MKLNKTVLSVLLCIFIVMLCSFLLGSAGRTSVQGGHRNPVSLLWIIPSWSAFSIGSLVSLSPGLGAHDEQRSLRALIHDDDAILIIFLGYVRS